VSRQFRAVIAFDVDGSSTETTGKRR
jgi:hypothetical protein